MKNKFLIVGILGLIASQNFVFAELTVDQASSGDYLLNRGYSPVFGQMVDKTKVNIQGVEYVSPEQKEYSGFVKWVRNVFIYLDPALESDTFMNHDINATPKIDDL